MDELATTITVSYAWRGVDNITGLGSGLVSDDAVTKNIVLSTGAANNVANGADEEVFKRYTIAGAGTQSVDLNSLTNVLGATISFARIKSLLIRLLSTADDATNGTAATHIVVGNGGAPFISSSSGRGWLVAANDLITIPNGGILLFATPGAAGVLSGAGAKDLLITNGDASVSAYVEVKLTGGST